MGLDNNLTRRISAIDPVTIAMLKGLVAGMADLGLGVFAGAPLRSRLAQPSTSVVSSSSVSLADS